MASGVAALNVGPPPSTAATETSCSVRAGMVAVVGASWSRGYAALAPASLPLPFGFAQPAQRAKHTEQHAAPQNRRVNSRVSRWVMLEVPLNVGGSSAGRP